MKSTCTREAGRVRQTLQKSGDARVPQLLPSVARLAQSHSDEDITDIPACSLQIRHHLRRQGRGIAKGESGVEVSSRRYDTECATTRATRKYAKKSKTRTCPQEEHLLSLDAYTKIFINICSCCLQNGEMKEWGSGKITT